MLVIPDLLTAQEIAVVRGTLERAPFVEGTISGKKSLKKNLQADKNHPEVQQATKAVISKMMSRREFTSFAMPKNVLLMFNRYDPGMTYKDHMDAALMGPSQAHAVRADLSFTVFLTDPDDYEGGEFILQTPFGAEKIKHPAGTLMCYPSTMLHRVDPIQKGTRWCAVGWMQSFLRLEEHRTIAHQLDDLRHRMADVLPEDSPLPEEFASVYQNLLRLWAEV
jgi:PKHD-type hydroxylase